jgi:hypothetical protein
MHNVYSPNVQQYVHEFTPAYLKIFKIHNLTILNLIFDILHGKKC